jgi:hypothetical protein
MECFRKFHIAVSWPLSCLSLLSSFPTFSHSLADSHPFFTDLVLLSSVVPQSNRLFGQGSILPTRGLVSREARGARDHQGRRLWNAWSNTLVRRRDRGAQGVYSSELIAQRSVRSFQTEGMAIPSPFFSPSVHLPGLILFSARLLLVLCCAVPGSIGERCQDASSSA